jgi:meso-butanediol dehydrogenase / (S,S)-butanediol dehydrogenase / diacetyl reductase
MGRYEELRGQVAIVTGAGRGIGRAIATRLARNGRGIGRAIATRLAREGAAVAVTDVDKATAEQTSLEIGDKGGKTLALEVDVLNQQHVDQMIAKTTEKLGPLAIFVHNAGVGAVGKLLDTDAKTWDWMMNVNAKGTFLACKAAALQMIKQGRGGRIIVNASGAGKIAPGKDMPLGAYAASKHAVVGFSKQLGLEVSSHQVLVNCICPGIVDTPMWDLIDRETAKIRGVPVGSVKSGAVAGTPLGRIQTPDDVANVVAFLASDDASYITADAVNCAGGLLPY